jgi:hypothetical protein
MSTDASYSGIEKNDEWLLCSVKTWVLLAGVYFDGLNCFYVADEVSKLKERLPVPSNVFDQFLRSWDRISSQVKRFCSPKPPLNIQRSSSEFRPQLERRLVWIYFLLEYEASAV